MLFGRVVINGFSFCGANNTVTNLKLIVLFVSCVLKLGNIWYQCCYITLAGFKIINKVDSGLASLHRSKDMLVGEAMLYKHPYWPHYHSCVPQKERYACWEAMHVYWEDMFALVNTSSSLLHPHRVAMPCNNQLSIPMHGICQSAINYSYMFLRLGLHQLEIFLWLGMV